ncbi:MAG: glucose-6-phosphate isomerase [Alphaproteobacteria bacterium]|jgi:glucose-6-phosphate isomerase|nr:glucose-6-phosphate isomerase [Alphaproteobacteria bacterium]
MTLPTHDLSTLAVPARFSSSTLENVVSTLIKDTTEGRLTPLSIVHDDVDLARFEKETQFLSEYRYLVVLGTGGSSLGAKSLYALTKPNFLATKQQMFFVENVDPMTLNALLRDFPPQETGYLAISKSGTTAETMAQFLCVLKHLRNTVGASSLGDRCLVITQPTDSPMKRLATRLALKTLDHPPTIGGRFSVFSCVGLVPALLRGVDVKEVRAGARAALSRFTQEKEASAVAQSAAAFAAYSTTGYNAHVTMPYCDKLTTFTLWWRQLWAESLGKKGLGTQPVPAVGTTDQHSQLQLFLEGPKDKFYTLLFTNAASRGPDFPAEDLDADSSLSYLEGRTMGDLMDAEQRATLQCLRNKKLPVRVLSFDALTPFVMGALMMEAMLETILVAKLMNIDPFSQDAVEEGKVLTRTYLKEMA